MFRNNTKPEELQILQVLLHILKDTNGLKIDIHAYSTFPLFSQFSGDNDLLEKNSPQERSF